MQKVKKWFTKLKVICLVCVAVFIALFALVGVMGRATNKIVITGDAEVMEYIETLAYYYTNYVNTDISIDVNAPGSSQAVKDVSEGIADYGIIARNLYGGRKPGGHRFYRYGARGGSVRAHRQQ